MDLADAATTTTTDQGASAADTQAAEAGTAMVPTAMSSAMT